MTTQGGRFCLRCNQMTLHVHRGASHVLHLLLSVFTLGLWLPIWLVVGIASAATPPACQTCGSTDSPNRRQHEKSFRLTRS